MANLLRNPCLPILMMAIAWCGPAAAGTASIVIDADSGIVIEASDATTRWYPASLTKVMTLYLVFEAIEAGHLTLDEKLTVSSHAASQPATELGLGAGSKITVKQAILGVILRSANDAAVVLAERVGGTEQAFAERMNRKAKQLGMARTRFDNATGLPDAAQVTTARDMAVLARALIHDYRQFYPLFSTTRFSYGGRSFGTINGILSRYEGADGIKTGFTCGSGYNLIASAKRNGRRLIAVLLGSHTNFERHSEMARLLDAGFAADSPGAAGELRLADLGETDGEEHAPPPLQLSALECAYGTSPTGTDAAVGGRLPGWGVIFGAFASRSTAQKTLSRATASLRAVMTAGQPTIVPRRWGGGRRYSALLVGLSRDQAGKACRRLWRNGAYCLALNPTVLNNPQAVWR